MIEDEILRLLKEDPSAFVSGEEISRLLKLSRTAIWKRVKKLRTLGYVIEALPRMGYRLIQSPDLLSPSEIDPLLRTEWMGKKVHYFNSIDSTNSTAYQLALDGARGRRSGDRRIPGEGEREVGKAMGFSSFSESLPFGGSPA